jgi:hypothetical protein
VIPQEFIVISKLDSAMRQVDEAIYLFFGKRDVVAIHTLASAAYQVVTDICKHRGIARELEDSTILEEFGVKKELLAAVRKPQNFFKHADKDHEGTVQLNPMLSVCIMMSTVQYLLQLGIKPSAEREVFRTWFFFKLPSHTPAEIKPILEQARHMVDPDDFSLFAAMIESTKTKNLA